MPTSKSHPVRTCVGCRQRAAKQDLLRVVAQDGVLAPDPDGRSPGRGAYLHRSTACLEAALRRRVFARALRVQAALDPQRVREHVEQDSSGETVRTD